MITDAIVSLIDSNFTELTKGVNLFAENDIVGPCVFVKSDSVPVGVTSKDVRKSNARFFIKGYGIADAIELGERIVSFFHNYKGIVIVNSKQYNIKAVDFIAFPFVASTEDKVVKFTANFYYIQQ